MKLIHNIMNAIINCLLVSMPEESIWFFTVLILMKRFDLLDKYMWKEKIKWLIIPFSSSIVINILKYIINSPIIFISISAIITIYIGIIIMLKAPENNILNEKIAHIKVFLLVLLSFAILIVLTECLYAPFLLKYFGKSIIEVNNVWLINFLMSIPARVIQFVMIIFILSIQNREVYLNILQSILSDKKISLIIIAFIFILIIFWTLLINIFGNYNILSQYGFNEQVLYSILLFIVPSILLILMISLIVLFIEKINKLNRSHQNMFNDIYDDYI